MSYLRAFNYLNNKEGIIKKDYNKCVGELIFRRVSEGVLAVYENEINDYNMEAILGFVTSDNDDRLTKGYFERYIELMCLEDIQRGFDNAPTLEGKETYIATKDIYILVRHYIMKI